MLLPNGHGVVPGVHARLLPTLVVNYLNIGRYWECTWNICHSHGVPIFQLQATLVVNCLNIGNYPEWTYLKYAYLNCLLQARLVVNYPNIGRNFLLSADHRLPHYPQFPSQQMWLQASDQHACDYCSCCWSSLVWLQLQHFHQGVITGSPQCTQYQRKYGPRATRQMLVVDYKRWNGW